MSIVLTVCVKVFRQTFYLIVSVLVAISMAAVTLLWANIPLLIDMLSTDSTSLVFTLSFAGKLLWGAPQSMGGLAVTLVLLNSILLGMIVSMTWYAWQIKKRQGISKSLVGATGGGVLAALLGIGCIACGPLLLGSIFALVGAGGVLLLLPLHGAELGVVAFFLLLYALYSVQKVIAAPLVCAVTED